MNQYAKWESSIVRIEKNIEQDIKEDHNGPVIFYGSSSIRNWKTLDKDFTPMFVINAGFGGSTLPDLIYYYKRVLKGQSPSGVVIYAGDNDLSMRKAKYSPEDVLSNFKKLSTLIINYVKKNNQNGTVSDKFTIYFISIKPSRRRIKYWPKMSEANELVQAYCATSTQLVYIDVATHMLGKSGNSKSEYLSKDGLHLSEQGYQLWTKIIKPYFINSHFIENQPVNSINK